MLERYEIWCGALICNLTNVLEDDINKLNQLVDVDLPRRIIDALCSSSRKPSCWSKDSIHDLIIDNIINYWYFSKKWYLFIFVRLIACMSLRNYLGDRLSRSSQTEYQKVHKSSDQIEQAQFEGKHEQPGGIEAKQHTARRELEFKLLDSATAA